VVGDGIYAYAELAEADTGPEDGRRWRLARRRSRRGRLRDGWHFPDSSRWPATRGGASLGGDLCAHEGGSSAARGKAASAAASALRCAALRCAESRELEATLRGEEANFPSTSTTGNG
jgi:hypothetical protein